jgi:glycosyltransferase involved in cell wall biosynthesis
MNYNPLVSVIIPLYNSEKYISETIKSVISQTYKNWEIIIVDDGSTDNSLLIARSFESEKIKILSINNGGASRARNYGYACSKGSIIQFLDADDILDEYKIEKQIEIYLFHGPDYIYSSLNGIINGNSKYKINSSPLYFDFSISDYFDAYFNHFGLFFQQQTWLASRKLIDKAGLWDKALTFNDDGDFFSRLVLFSSGIKFVPDSISFYRVDSINSLSKRKDKSSYTSYLNSAKNFEKIILNNFNNIKNREFASKMYSKVFCETYPKYKDIYRECESSIKSLGSDTIYPFGGSKFNFISKNFGVKVALLLLFYKKSIYSLLG